MGSPSRSGAITLALLLAFGFTSRLAFAQAPAGASTFRRGDVNGDGAVDVSDPIAILIHWFVGGSAPPCDDATDLNDDGQIDLADAVAALHFIFVPGAPSPPPPYPHCGTDLTPDALDCAISTPGCGLIPLPTATSELFPTRRLFPRNGFVYGTAFGDLDSDGLPDAVVGRQSGMVLFLGTGPLDWIERPDLALGPEASGACALGDLDADGNLDLVTGDPLSVLLGLGDGTFLPPTPIGPPDPFSSTIELVDLTGDGTLDILARSLSGVMVVHVGLGGGVFSAPIAFPLDDIQDLEIGDFDSDGLPDLALVSAATGAAVYFGVGNGTFTAGPAFGTSLNIATGDLNGDGNLDVLTQTPGTADLETRLGTGFGTFGAPFPTGPLAGIAPILVDLDQDGVLDLLSSTSLPPLLVVSMGNGNGTFTMTSSRDFRVTETIDLDGDGIDELIGRHTYGVSIARGLLGGALDLPLISASGVDADRTDLEDLDGDGILDVIVSSEADDEFSFSLGLGDGTFDTPSLVPLPELARELELVDLDDDGIRDLVFLGVPSQLIVLISSGAGTFSPPVVVPLPTFTYSITHGDFNGDGFADIAARLASSELLLLFGNGLGSLTPGPLLTLDEAIEIAAIDLNGDGVDDFFGIGDNEGRTFLSNGVGGIDPGEEFVLAPNARIGEIADVTGDGIDDVVIFGDSSEGSVTILRGDGNGSLVIDQTLFGPRHGNSARVADLDANGSPDLIVGAGGQVSVYLRIPGATLPERASFFAGGLGLSVGDVDGDGDIDIVSGNGFDVIHTQLSTTIP